MTAIISSQNFFFQSIIENGISKKDIIAQKTFKVIDVKIFAAAAATYVFFD